MGTANHKSLYAKGFTLSTLKKPRIVCLHQNPEALNHCEADPRQGNAGKLKYFSLAKIRAELFISHIPAVVQSQEILFSYFQQNKTNVPDWQESDIFLQNSLLSKPIATEMTLSRFVSNPC